MSEPMDPGKMKVVELRAELAARGLDTKGVKAVLVDRLKEALEQETGKALPNTSIADTSTEDAGDVSYSEQQDEKAEDNDCEMQEDSENLTEPPEDKGKQPLEVKEEKNSSEASVVIKEEKGITEPNTESADAFKKLDMKQESVQIKKEDTNNEVKTETKMDTDENKKTEERKDSWHDKGNEDRRGEKRKHSPSPHRRAGPPRRPDDEPEYDENAVLLSWYDSDLNIVIHKDDFTTATPMHEQGFGYIWAGARASHGFTSGKICYEVKLLENCPVSNLEDEPNPHVLRAGWSVEQSSTQLGEEPLSYGYGGTAKASTDCKFKDYGKPFIVGDVVGCFLDLDSEPIIMSFTVNGEPQGVAYEIAKSDLKGKALFPHVLTKNIKFECNFGDKEPWFPPLNGYVPAAKIPVEQRVAGARRPKSREDCEMIMMCGLPGCGKTTWANEWYAKHPDKKYNVLGTNNLIDKMKVMGLPRKRNYAGRWDVLIDNSTKCLNKLFEVASRRRRNYILDQTNVYPSAQRRKMRGFEGFIRRAVVIVPTDEEFKRRIAQREKLEGKDVPDSAVLEMKANFMLPEVGDIFTEVIYTELNESESRILVSKYNREGRDAGYGNQNKRPRFENRDNRDFRENRDNRDSRDSSYNRERSSSYSSSYSSQSSYRGGFRPRGGPDNRQRSSSWQPRGGGAGGGSSWRDRPQHSGSYRSGSGSGSGNSHGSSSWRGSGGGGRGGRPDSGRGGYDRNKPSGNQNRSQSSGGKGSWGNYNQGSGGSGEAGSSGSSSGGWGQNYNQQSWGSQQNTQQGWKGYGQQQQQSYGQQNYPQQGYGNTAPYNWNQQYYNQGYGSGNQSWGQANADTSYGTNTQQQQQQQGAWQGYGQGYNYGSNQQAAPGGGYPK